MKNIFILGCLLTATSLSAQRVPIDFETEGNGADWTWTTFENDDNPPLEIIENPDKSGINTSNTVGKFTSRQTGAPFAGCESLHGADIGEYKLDATNSTITLMVYKPVLSDVGVKLVTSTGWSKGELKVANTEINEWEELTFDFSTVNHENMTYDQLVIFPDFRDRSEETISYFDNFTIGGRTATLEKIVDSPASIYPNPTTGLITLDANTAAFTVTSTTGQIVLSGHQNIANLTNLTTGIYIVRSIMNDGSIAYCKVSKQ
ncbi:T9SS type A sorting domain-containing protein [Bacteroidia bacterium]|nr:T9SS type A sorting domain-containing protein [Bacteroidia bacterium]